MTLSTSLKAAAFTAAVAATLVGCGSTSSPLSGDERNALRGQVTDARTMFINDKPVTKRYFDTAYAYAIFPSVKSGAVIVGGAGGDGEVYQGGKLVGTADIGQGSIGAQLGGQEFAEAVFFENSSTYETFTRGEWEFDAKASAVAADAGSMRLHSPKPALDKW